MIPRLSHTLTKSRTDCDRANWDKSLLEKGGHCQPPHVLADIYYATTAVNILTDWVTAMMFVPDSPVAGINANVNRPIPLLWHVQLERSAKASIIGLMSLGALYVLSTLLALCRRTNKTGLRSPPASA